MKAGTRVTLIGLVWSWGLRVIGESSIMRTGFVFLDFQDTFFLGDSGEGLSSFFFRSVLSTSQYIFANVKGVLQGEVKHSQQEYGAVVFTIRYFVYHVPLLASLEPG